MIRSIWLAVPTRLHAGFGDGLRRTVDVLMEILLKAQHYGSIDSAKTALQHICSTRGGALVEGVAHSCVDSLFEHMLRPGQSRRDAIRRSGGMPFGLQSVMVSSPKSRISATIMANKPINVIAIVAKVTPIEVEFSSVNIVARSPERR